MTAYAGIGDRPAIKLQYAKMEATLKKELSLTPSRTIRDLYENLMGKHDEEHSNYQKHHQN
jgi:DNA-binding transcriptional activator of the SARP family